MTSNNQCSIFDFQGYRQYLIEVLPTHGSQRGARLRLAQHLNCQSAHISQVLSGKNDLSFEQALSVCKFLDLNNDEREYFFLLLHLEKAGTKELKLYYLENIKSTQKKREQITHRIQRAQQLGEKEQLIYYSSWTYSAIHILTSIPAYQTQEAIRKFLKISQTKVESCLQFLCQTDLVIHENGLYRVGQGRIHLGRNSNLLSRHHVNWRLRAIDSLEGETDEKNEVKNLHYSGVVCLSEKDFKTVQEILLKAIESADQVLKESPEQILCGICIDFFKF